MPLSDAKSSTQKVNMSSNQNSRIQTKGKFIFKCPHHVHTSSNYSSNHFTYSSVGENKELFLKRAWVTMTSYFTYVCFTILWLVFLIIAGSFKQTCCNLLFYEEHFQRKEIYRKFSILPFSLVLSNKLRS